MGEHIASCHCGNLTALVLFREAPEDVPLRACQCSFCRKHGAITIGAATDYVRFAAEDYDLVTRYRFGGKTADFLVCRRCGIYVGAVCETPAGVKGIVNLNALTDRLAFTRAAEPMNYDGENAGARIDRRAERWMSASVWF